MFNVTKAVKLNENRWNVEVRSDSGSLYPANVSRDVDGTLVSTFDTDQLEAYGYNFRITEFLTRSTTKAALTEAVNKYFNK